MTVRVMERVRRMLPPGVALAVWTEDLDTTLYAEEARVVERATPSRQAEFARGRACARKAMSDLGIGRSAIVAGEGRQPLWPEGYTGSITHCIGFTGAVVAALEDVSAIGLDAEPALPLPLDARDAVLTASERAAGADDLVLETVVFSAKESIHKALFPGTGVWMDFLDVELSLDRARQSFSATPAAGASATAPGLEGLVGRYAISEGYVLTVAYRETGGG